MNNALQLIDNICEGGKTPNRNNLLRLEEMNSKLPQLELPTRHFIHGGMYARELFIPKDTILTGAIYKFDHFDIMISGDITVSTDTGETKRLIGYNLFKGLSGKKRAGYAHQDTLWITFHPVTGNSGDQIQELITAQSFDDLDKFNIEMNRNDFFLLVEQTNMTAEEIRAQSENTSDLILDELINVYVSNSQIEGKGLFSRRLFSTDKLICQSRKDGKRTLAGRYANHALYPNSKMVFDGENMNLISIKDIEEGEEITVSYRDVLQTRIKRGELCQE